SGTTNAAQYASASLPAPSVRPSTASRTSPISREPRMLTPQIEAAIAIRRDGEALVATSPAALVISGECSEAGGRPTTAWLRPPAQGFRPQQVGLFPRPGACLPHFWGYPPGSALATPTGSGTRCRESTYVHIGPGGDPVS